MKRKTKYRIYVSFISISVFAFFFTLTSIHAPSSVSRSTKVTFQEQV